MECAFQSGICGGRGGDFKDSGFVAGVTWPLVIPRRLRRHVGAPTTWGHLARPHQHGACGSHVSRHLRSRTHLPELHSGPAVGLASAQHEPTQYQCRVHCIFHTCASVLLCAGELSRCPCEFIAVAVGRGGSAVGPSPAHAWAQLVQGRGPAGTAAPLIRCSVGPCIHPGPLARPTPRRQPPARGSPSCRPLAA